MEAGQGRRPSADARLPLSPSAYPWKQQIGGNRFPDIVDCIGDNKIASEVNDEFRGIETRGDQRENRDRNGPAFPPGRVTFLVRRVA